MNIFAKNALDILEPLATSDPQLARAYLLLKKTSVEASVLDFLANPFVRTALSILDKFQSNKRISEAIKLLKEAGVEEEAEVKKKKAYKPDAKKKKVKADLMKKDFKKRLPDYEYILMHTEACPYRRYMEDLPRKGYGERETSKAWERRQKSFRDTRGLLPKCACGLGDLAEVWDTDFPEYYTLPTDVRDKAKELGLLKVRGAQSLTELEEIHEQISELTPDDCGTQDYPNYLLAFEGFNEDCWDDAEANGKTIESLETEILGDWRERHSLGDPIEFGWRAGGDWGGDECFWAIYKKTDSPQDAYTNALYADLWDKYGFNLDKATKFWIEPDGTIDEWEGHHGDYHVDRLLTYFTEDIARFAENLGIDTENQSEEDSETVDAEVWRMAKDAGLVRGWLPSPDVLMLEGDNSADILPKISDFFPQVKTLVIGNDEVPVDEGEDIEKAWRLRKSIRKRMRASK